MKKIGLMLLVVLTFSLAVSSFAFAKNESCHHKWRVNEIEEPSYSFPGYKLKECVLCGKLNDISIPAKKMTRRQKKAFRPLDKFDFHSYYYDFKDMCKCFKKKPSGLFKYKSMQKVAAIANQKYFSMDVKKIKCKKKICSFKITINYANYERAIAQAFWDLTIYQASHKKMSSKKVAKRMSKKLRKYFKKYKPEEKKETFWVKTVKTKKGWKIKKSYFRLINSVNFNFNRVFK